MRRLFAVTVCLWALLSVGGCGVNKQSAADTVPSNETETIQTGKTETAGTGEAETESREMQGDMAEVTSGNADSHILIAYFTWAENTVVEDESQIDVDATTSASVLAPGNAARIAGWIQERTGGDLFSIVVTEPYSSDYDACLDRAAEEKAAGARPGLVYHVEDMEQYDVVFIGYAGGIIGLN